MSLSNWPVRNANEAGESKLHFAILTKINKTSQNDEHTSGLSFVSHVKFNTWQTGDKHWNVYLLNFSNNGGCEIRQSQIMVLIIIVDINNQLLEFVEWDEKLY